MNKLELLEIAAINNDYNNFISFLESYNNVTIPEFDYYLINKLSLFMVHENFSFDNLDQMISKINYVLPDLLKKAGYYTLALEEAGNTYNLANFLPSRSNIWIR